MTAKTVAERKEGMMIDGGTLVALRDGLAAVEELIDQRCLDVEAGCEAAEAEALCGDRVCERIGCLLDKREQLLATIKRADA